MLVRSHQRFAFSTGYLGDPEDLPPASWRRTGDRVVREPDGWFRFVDRVKDVIRRRGENVSSQEVETALRAHPAVADAAAVPVPSELAEDWSWSRCCPAPAVPWIPGTWYATTSASVA
ncbi:hypothetical protein AB0I77_26380 [Streptomyces sp. NPDC050619]|uniref:hypothetical protein n=1 Tax=Streptomyces sp. NPDC050619 TaxID=3157214 RepID=UPI0034270693